MLAWHELLTDLAWHEILHWHFRPSQNRKWITAKWLTHGKQLQEVVVWGKLENPLLATHFNIFWIKKQAFTHDCHLNGPSLAQKIHCDKILFSHTRRWYRFLFLSFFLSFFVSLFFVFMLCYVIYFVIINFCKKCFLSIVLFFTIIIYYYYFY